MAGFSSTSWGAPASGSGGFGAGGYGSGFGYNPGSTYGGAPNQATAELIAGPNGYLENEPRAIWDRWAGRSGLAAGNPNGDFQQWLNSQYGVAQRGYKAAIADSPNLMFQQYLSDPRFGFTEEQVRQQYRMQTPQARGEQWGLYAPRVRYLGR